MKKEKDQQKGKLARWVNAKTKIKHEVLQMQKNRLWNMYWKSGKSKCM